MTNSVIILTWTAAVIGFTHTIFGPDHYIPFIALSKMRNWSCFKTSAITFLCGIGHVLSSIILGFIGIFLGISVFKLEAIESSRGEFAGWLLLIFGFLYFIWGINRAIRSRPHKHPHPHEDGKMHLHTHTHIADHLHPHESKSGSITPWVLFTIFVFGPCEPLIPLIMYPAAKFDLVTVAIVAFVFGLTTISTMLFVVMASYFGLSRLPLNKMERYAHAMAGLAIFICGFAVKFMGL